MTHSYALARAMQTGANSIFYAIALFLWCFGPRAPQGSAAAFILAGAALAWTARLPLLLLIFFGFGLVGCRGL